MTLIAGIAGFFAIATFALLPFQAAKNRDTYVVVERYAHKLAAIQSLPSSPEVNDAFTETVEGIPVWPSLPSGCSADAFEERSDQFVLGFWENRSASRFGGNYWHCYAYPSGKTTMHRSVAAYLGSVAGRQILVLALIAASVGFVASRLIARRDRRNLNRWVKAIWLAVFMTAIELIYFFQDSGDDQFFRRGDTAKAFVSVYEGSIGYITGKCLVFIENSPVAPIYWPLILFVIWMLIGLIFEHLTSWKTTSNEAIRSRSTSR